MIAMCFNSYALIHNDVSDEDQEELSQLINDTQLLKTQETEQEWRIFLDEHRYFVQSMIRRINVLVYKYPHKADILDLVEVRDYLQNEIIRFGL